MYHGKFTLSAVDSSERRGRRFLPSACVSATLILLGSFLFFGQTVMGADDEQPEPVTIPTSDGVPLRATYYPGVKDTNTVPVILLHDYEGCRNDYAELALMLQKEGHAVLVPDLRGHGDSTTQRVMNLSRNDFANMAQFDFHALKFFLIKKNNDRELNIEKLCIVGAGMGGSVALFAACVDWNVLPSGNKKQGQDVKAVVIISPDWSTPGLPVRGSLTGRPVRIRVWDRQLQQAFREPESINFNLPVDLDFRREVSFMIVAGKGKSKALRDAKRLEAMLKSYHPAPPPNEVEARKSLFYAPLATSLQGTKILGKGLKLERYIVKFIQLRAVNRKLAWQERRNPYER